MDYFESRYYSSAAGRFLSPDEARADNLTDPFTGQALFSDPGHLPYADIANPQSLNKYAYTNNNPLRFTDADGHCGGVCVAAVVALFSYISYQIYKYARRFNADVKKEKEGEEKMTRGMITDDADQIIDGANEMHHAEAQGIFDGVKAGEAINGAADVAMSAASSAVSGTAANSVAGESLQQGLDSSAEAAKAIVSQMASTAEREKEEERKKEKQEEDQQASQSSTSSSSTNTTPKSQ